MSDAVTGEILWQDDDWGELLQERDIHIPRRILQCRAVSREFQFSSVEMLHGLRLEQRIFFRGGLWCIFFHGGLWCGGLFSRRITCSGFFRRSLGNRFCSFQALCIFGNINNL